MDSICGKCAHYEHCRTSDLQNTRNAITDCYKFASKKEKCPVCGRETEYYLMIDGKLIGCPKCGGKKLLTNADRIRGMTDEELAECLYDITDNGYSADQWLEWLKEVGK